MTKLASKNPDAIVIGFCERMRKNPIVCLVDPLVLYQLLVYIASETATLYKNTKYTNLRNFKIKYIGEKQPQRLAVLHHNSIQNIDKEWPPKIYQTQAFVRFLVQAEEKHLLI